MIVLNEHAVFIENCDNLFSAILARNVRDKTGRVWGLASIPLPLVLKRLYYFGVSSVLVLFFSSSIMLTLLTQVSVTKIGDELIIDPCPVAYIDSHRSSVSLSDWVGARLDLELEPVELIVCTDLVCELRLSFEPH